MSTINSVINLVEFEIGKSNIKRKTGVQGRGREIEGEHKKSVVGNKIATRGARKLQELNIDQLWKT